MLIRFLINLFSKAPQAPEGYERNRKVMPPKPFEGYGYQDAEYSGQTKQGVGYRVKGGHVFTMTEARQQELAERHARHGDTWEHNAAVATKRAGRHG